MAIGRYATALICLDAVVIDTETTGLDPRNARVVEIAAVGVTGGCLDSSLSTRHLVNPGEPIPAAAARIHGIGDAAVAGAPAFAEVWPRFAEYIGSQILIGHSIGFDLAVIKRECERAGVAWQPAEWLDTRLLAQIAEPALADHSLETLASWLGVEITGRHSALGDASLAATIFCALVPKLRDRGIRTLAEAMRASHALADAAEAQHRAGWNAPMLPGADVSALRADTYPYRHRVADIMSAPARSIGPDATLGEALRLIAGDKISSLFVSAAGQPAKPAETGIVTERDIMRALDAYGAGALGMPAHAAMSRPLATVAADALAYAAIGRMNRLRVRHLGVTDDAGLVVGALSARDLLRLRAEEAVELGDEIETATDVNSLARAWGRLAHIAAALTAEGLAARETAAVISQRVGEMTRQAAVLAEAEMMRSGRGGPPCRYALLVLGSAGRGESLLAMDQDNALIVADDAPAGADQWFEAFTVRVADILHAVGIPYCEGGVMAKNSEWRGLEREWRRRVDRWIGHSKPADLLAVDIFFDLRCVHGDVELATSLRRYALDAARGQAGFAKLLIDSVGFPSSARTWLGGIRTEEGRIDLKRHGLFGVVSAARALAILHHVAERSTPARLADLKALNPGMESDLGALIGAHAEFLGLILDQQIEDLKRGLPATNKVEVRRLARSARARLVKALASVEHLEEMSRAMLFRT
jgi:DNA polymerase-3 subunit epsilon/CBS domain-containing protein